MSLVILGGYFLLPLEKFVQYLEEVIHFCDLAKNYYLKGLSTRLGYEILNKQPNNLAKSSSCCLVTSF